jgi:hypothetical protein
MPPRGQSAGLGGAQPGRSGDRLVGPEVPTLELAHEAIRDTRVLSRSRSESGGEGVGGRKAGRDGCR